MLPKGYLDFPFCPPIAGTAMTYRILLSYIQPHFRLVRRGYRDRPVTIPGVGASDSKVE